MTALIVIVAIVLVLAGSLASFCRRRRPATTATAVGELARETKRDQRTPQRPREAASAE